MHVKFTMTRIVDDDRKGTPAEERYEAGQVYDLPGPSAQHWIDRGVAVPAPAEVIGRGTGAKSRKNVSAPKART